MSGSNSELVNALSGGGLLSAIANPRQVNVLGAYGDAAKVAQGIWANREAQAHQLAGQAILDATQPDGSLDIAKYRQNMQRAGSGVALAAPAEMSRAQQLGTQSQDQGLQLQDAVRKALPSVLNLPDDQLHAGVQSALTSFKNTGLTTDARNLQIMSGLSNDPAQLRVQLNQMQKAMLPPTEQRAATYGTQGTQTGPGGNTIGTIQAPVDQGAGVSAAPQAGAPLGMSPAEMNAETPIYTKDPNDPTKYIQVPQARSQRPGVGMTPPTSTPSPGNPQGTPAPGSAGITAPQGAQPGRIRPADPNSPLLRQPPAGAAAPAAASPLLAPPQGQPQQLTTDITARDAAMAAMGDQQKRLIAGQSALEALQLADTGPGTSFVARANAFLKAQGITTVEKGALSDTDYRQLLQKNLLRFAQTSGKSSGTDLGLETQIHSNANADEMLAGANRHVLIQDMGVLKRDIAQTKEMPEPSGNADVVKHIGKFPANTAPEAFMWNAYSQPERDAIEAKYAKDGQTDKLHRSLEIAVRRGSIPDPRNAAPPAATPPAATSPAATPPRVPAAMLTPSNALASSGQQNMLAMG